MGESFGSDRARVVFLHGWARTREDFAPAASLLAARGVSSVAWDLPGFGATPAPTTAGGTAMYAAVVRDALKELSSEPVVLVGHSFGGRVSVVVASEYPELVRAVVLTGVPLLRSSTPARVAPSYRVVRWLARHGLLSASRLEAARQRHGSTDYRRAQGVVRDVLVATVNEDYTTNIAKVTAPVELLWGGDDQVVPVNVATRASELFATARLDILSGVGHLLPLEAPGALVTAVERALSA